MNGSRVVGCIMDLSDALSFVAAHRNAILVTLKRDGRPQLSNVVYHLGDDGLVRVSITADRAKYANLRRDPRVSLHVNRADFYGYVVLEAEAELSAVAAAGDDATVDELVELYRGLAGEHSDWDDYRRAMVADRRVVLRIRPTHVYGMLGG
ncbi:MAG: pyridoxamine 5'-phosphate oxidase-like FMN-binding protein [Acidimicrobiaceae bacterium]|nr:MAG: pyridoxamine 5'-phosphate oxidase-like FMN-binding protein [Acidimicrobiaceae bacterium]